MSAASLATAPGSSPRMRGKLRQLRHRLRHSGLIPAHAGKTPSHTQRPRIRSAHPRACGENAFLYRGTCHRLGSSPRMRGKHSLGVDVRMARGLIPAHAGKTSRFSAYPTNPAAHPRACGENRPRLKARTIAPGSSPRMRGKRVGDFAGFGVDGLIPAHAGKTAWTRLTTR